MQKNQRTNKKKIANYNKLIKKILRMLRLEEL